MKKSRITEVFERRRQEGKKVFIPYIMAGDGSLEKTARLVNKLESWGADIIELGVPFSDPMADGPTIQLAAQRAIRQGVTLRKIIHAVSSMRDKTSIPIVLMTYFNPIFRYGTENFVNEAVDSGVDGLIIPDMPPDEEKEFIDDANKKGLDTVFLVAPTSTEERLRLITKMSQGFIYYVSMTGITGAKLRIGDELTEQIRLIRTITTKPVAIGFGVKTAAEARESAVHADGVIVGSSIVRMAYEDEGNLDQYVRSLREAI